MSSHHDENQCCGSHEHHLGRSGRTEHSYSTEDLLTQLDDKSVIFVGGKGGVGKTTTSAALAVRFARRGERTLIVSTDPAHSLGDILKLQLSGDTRTICDNLDAQELDPDTIVKEHFSQVERTIAGYTTPEMMPRAKKFLRLSFDAPGATEAAMLEAICRKIVSAKDSGYQHLIFDTAPTGHTLRLLTLPEMMQAYTDGLLSMQRRQSRLRGAADAMAKHRESNPLAPKQEDRWESAVKVLEERRKLFAQARKILQCRHQTAILLVLIPESLPLSETCRAVERLESGGLSCAGLFVNQVMDPEQDDDFWRQRAVRQQEILCEVERLLGHLPNKRISLRSSDIRGIAALSEIF